MQINITEHAAPENVATLDKPTSNLVGNTYSKTQFDEKIDDAKTELQQLVTSDFKGIIEPSTQPTQASWEIGSYKPKISSEDNKDIDPNNWGTLYPFAGNLRAKKGFDTLFYFNGTTWSKSEVEMPSIDVQTTQGKNIFDKDTMVHVGLVKYGGNVLAHSNYKYAEVVVEPNTTYKLSKAPSGGIVWYNFLNASGTVIENASFNETNESMIGIITSPANAVKWQLNVVNLSTGSESEGVGDLDVFQIEKGTVTTDYEPYGEVLKSVNGANVPNPIIPNPNYIDKNVMVCGDSITEAVGAISWYEEMLKTLSFKHISRYARSGATWTNYAGTTDSPNDNSGVNNTISNQILKIFAQYDAGSLPLPDVIAIFAGVNDARDMALGTINGAFPSYDDEILSMPAGSVNTMTEAIRWNCERILQKFPNCQIILATPHQSGNSNLQNVRNARDLILESGVKLSAKVIDQFAESGIYSFNEVGSKHTFLSDNLHPNAAGAQKIGKYLAHTLKQVII